MTSLCLVVGAHHHDPVIIARRLAAAAAVLGGGVGGRGGSRRRSGLGVDWPAGNVGRHPANKIVVEGRVGHPAQAIEDGGVFLIHETGDAGVAGLSVRDGGKHCRQVRDELLGVEVRLRDFRKSSRRSDRLVLLREVGLDSGGVVAGDLEVPKVLELVEPLQAVEGELVEHPIVLVHCEEGQTVVVFRQDAVSGSRVLEVEQAACPRHMSESAQVTTSCENHRGAPRISSAPEGCGCGARWRRCRRISAARKGPFACSR